jgi:hypothetical protein
LNSGNQGKWLHGVDVSKQHSAAEKAERLPSSEVKNVKQSKLLDSPDARINFNKYDLENHISEIAECYQGLVTGDIERFTHKLWEVSALSEDWLPFRRSNNISQFYADVSEAIFWQNGCGQLHTYASMTRNQLHDMHESGNRAWGKRGIAINRMRDLKAVPYWGEHFDNNVAVVYPASLDKLTPLLCFLSSDDFHQAIRELDQAIKVTNRTLMKVPFDLEYWNEIAGEQYPHGLPEPYSDDPTQWIFHGHPCGSVIWNEDAKWTAHGPLRTDDTVLQVAVARLLGYRWPAELDREMELAEEQREWVNRCEALLGHADRDGIVCLPAVRGERRAVDRLEALLADAYGDQWSATTRSKLLESVDHAGKDLESWLRDKFFTQHCKLFQHRPFIWHVWDGLTDGFSALVNYHKLDYKALETLTYTYLGDWITQQKKQITDGIDGAEARLAASEALQKSLELILEGEEPYDIFVRWKPLEEQPIGWHPDLNDGVRLNIRPFLSVPDVKKKGAGILRDKPNIHWKKDRGKDVESAPWYNLGPQLGGAKGDRINDYHLTLTAKRGARKQ